MGDPRKSSLLNGDGTPWGPKQFGRPSDPAYEQDYVTDLNDSRIKGYDNSPQKAAFLNDVALSGGDAQNQYLAGQSRLMGGVARSTGSAGGLRGLAAQTQRVRESGLADFATKERQDRYELTNLFNSAKDRRNALKKSKFDSEAARDMAEDQQRGQFWNSILGAVGSAAGGFLGGK